jgi:predicted enzyme related to lactoylglutathione lyase
MAKAATAKKPPTPAENNAPPWMHGHFCWNELRTSDARAAMKFYGDAIGWTFQRTATPDGMDYWLAMEKGTPVAGIFHLVSAMANCVPESWMGFLAVDDVDARVKKAEKAGAKLVMPIFDVPNVGRIAMLLEPGGAGIGWMTPAGKQAMSKRN